MRKSLLILVSSFAFFLLSIASSTQAGSLASAPLYAGPAQKTALCTLRNVGASRILIKSVQLDSSGLFLLIINIDNCSNRFLEPGKFCSVEASDLPNNRYVACNAEFAGSARNIRGSLNLQDVSHNVLQIIELR